VRGDHSSYTPVAINGSPANRVDLVVIGDGYVDREIDTRYPQHVQRLVEFMFHEREDPFPRYARFFNIHRVNIVSKESGADVPDESIFRDTALDATYQTGTFSLLLIDIGKADFAAAHALEGMGIAPDIRVATVNTDRGLGSGGHYAVYAGGDQSGHVIALHEIGHSFSGLADEWGFLENTWNGDEWPQPNCTNSPSGAKWARWIGYQDPDHVEMSSIGAYEGCAYWGHGLFRPSQESKMNNPGVPFDAVSREQIILDIYELVDPLDDWLPNDTPLVQPSSLWVETVDPDVIDVEWLVDGAVAPEASGEIFSLPTLSPGVHTITAHALDDTPWVRLESPLLHQHVAWTVVIPIPEPCMPRTFTALALILAARRRKRMKKPGRSH
jgi:hypothetical protein